MDGAMGEMKLRAGSLRVAPFGADGDAERFEIGGRVRPGGLFRCGGGEGANRKSRGREHFADGADGTRGTARWILRQLRQDQQQPRMGRTHFKMLDHALRRRHQNRLPSAEAASASVDGSGVEAFCAWTSMDDPLGMVAVSALPAPAAVPSMSSETE
jgi:hypothetical protein